MAIGAVALGPVQPDRRIRLRHHQAGRDRLPVRLRQSALACRAARCSTRRAPSGLRVDGLAERHHWSTCWASASTTRPAGNSPANNYNAINPYEPGSYLNAKNIKYNPNNWINAALAGIGDGHNGGGPIWAIFDADAVAREKWDPKPPHVDIDAGFFFSADTLERARGEDRDEISARADAAAKSRRDGGALQFLRRRRRGRRFRQADAALQDRQAAVLRRLGDAGDPRHARRPAHQRATAR